MSNGKLCHDIDNDGEIGREPEYPDPPISDGAKLVWAFIAAMAAGALCIWLGSKLFIEPGHDGIPDAERSFHEGM